MIYPITDVWEFDFPYHNRNVKNRFLRTYKIAVSIESIPKIINKSTKKRMAGPSTRHPRKLRRGRVSLWYKDLIPRAYFFYRNPNKKNVLRNVSLGSQPWEKGEWGHIRPMAQYKH